VLFSVMYLLLHRLVRLLANSSKDLKGDVKVVVLRHQQMVLSATWPFDPALALPRCRQRVPLPGRNRQSHRSMGPVLVVMDDVLSQDPLEMPPPVCRYQQRLGAVCPWSEQALR
jgi:hypothetical protein